MFLRLLLLFTVIPLAELWLLLEMSKVTSAALTFGLVLATGFIGAALARRQGWQTWRQIQEQMANGQVPTSALLDGLMILIAGAVLITPGVLTDVFGFLLLIPPVRKAIKKLATAWFRKRSEFQFHTVNTANPDGFDEVIDAEFTTGNSGSASKAETPQDGPLRLS